ncbi:MAG: single-stranded DNA-binding protein [Campylobacter sp.]|uniref:single-stranded DNA-binding protein n=1 Tax=Campylobacter sp. TaxID=205 RepID=UPI002A82223B|nr:single-stranded DNA-binding protein [Campylobacter sp.]MCI7586424.1 single-stranded DNA-binding protein [Campylobacter sp.]MDY5115961.1 single-stranded DNA-binding protein [Campylobacter sp.]
MTNTLIGTLCQEVETKPTQSGCIFTNSIAVNKKDSQGNQKTTFIALKAWNGTAELIAKWYSKGDDIVISGELNDEVWQDQQSGQDRRKTYFYVNQVHFVRTARKLAQHLAGRANDNNLGYNQAPQAPQNYNQAPQAPQKYGNYDHMPDTVTNAVAKHNAQSQAQAQNTAQDLDEIPF